MNKVMIMGRITADPELKTTTNGYFVTSITVAVDRKYVAKGEERQTDFIDVVAWRQTAEFICKYFEKGSAIVVEGSLQSRNFEDKNGNKRKMLEVQAENVEFAPKFVIEKKTDKPKEEKPEDDFMPIADDDLPF